MKINPILNLTTINYCPKNNHINNKNISFLGQLDKDVFISSKSKMDLLYDYFSKSDFAANRLRMCACTKIMGSFGDKSKS